MHFAKSYGESENKVNDTHTDHALPEKDDWRNSKMQVSLNEKGAYIHRFRRKPTTGPVQNFAEAVSNIVSPLGVSVAGGAHIIPTCATFVGPSLCRTYAHKVWQNSAGFLFSPNTRTTLGYKGDINTHRLKRIAERLGHFVPNQQNGNVINFDAACTDYAEFISQKFNEINIHDPTGSAFKNGKKKSLNIVVSSQYQQLKNAEMEARAGFYFMGNGSEPLIDGIDVDRPSKYVILDLLKKYGIDYKSLSKHGLIQKLQSYISKKPHFAVYLLAPLIKITNFTTDRAVFDYLTTAENVRYIRDKNSSYSEFLSYVRENPPNKDPELNDSRLDPVTTLTPNEVQLVPRPEDLIGLTFDFRAIDSFNQGIEAMKLLKSSNTTKHVGDRISPFLHLISHFKGTSLTQLGWSHMVMPWSREGLIKFAENGFVEGIDSTASNPKFLQPDFYLIFQRIAARGHLNLTFSDEHLIDILRVYSSVPNDFHTVSSPTTGKTIVQQAAVNRLWSENNNKADNFKRAFELFCCIDALNLLNKNRSLNLELLNIQNQTNCSPEAALIAADIYNCDAESLNKKFTQLIEFHVNRIQALAERKASLRVFKRELRAGMTDVGHFTYNKDLGCIALTNGTRTFTNQVVQKGAFQHSPKMRDGGANFDYGVEKSPGSDTNRSTIRFGMFDKNKQLFGVEIKPATNNLNREFRLIDENQVNNLVFCEVKQDRNNVIKLSLKDGFNNCLRLRTPSHMAKTYETSTEEHNGDLKLLSASLQKLHSWQSNWVKPETVKPLMNLAFQIQSQIKNLADNLARLDNNIAGCSYFDTFGQDLENLLDQGIVPLLNKAFSSQHFDGSRFVNEFINPDNIKAYENLVNHISAKGLNFTMPAARQNIQPPAAPTLAVMNNQQNQDIGTFTLFDGTTVVPMSKQEFEEQKKIRAENGLPVIRVIPGENLLHRMTTGEAYALAGFANENSILSDGIHISPSMGVNHYGNKTIESLCIQFVQAGRKTAVIEVDHEGYILLWKGATKIDLSWSKRLQVGPLNGFANAWGKTLYERSILVLNTMKLPPSKNPTRTRTKEQVRFLIDLTKQVYDLKQKFTKSLKEFPGDLEYLKTGNELCVNLNNITNHFVKDLNHQFQKRQPYNNKIGDFIQLDNIYTYKQIAHLLGIFAPSAKITEQTIINANKADKARREAVYLLWLPKQAVVRGAITPIFGHKAGAPRGAAAHRKGYNNYLQRLANLKFGTGASNLGKHQDYCDYYEIDE